MCAFEQTAEIFFAGDNFRAFLVAEIGHGFIFHFESFESDDTDVFLVLFPDLALAEFHEDFWKNLSLLIFAPGETASNKRLLFLFRRCFFLGCGLLGFGFCGHNFIFLRLTFLRHGSFSEGNGIMRTGLSVVNGGRKIICRVCARCFRPKDSQR